MSALPRTIAKQDIHLEPTIRHVEAAITSARR
jgi:hypothetical protein